MFKELSSLEECGILLFELQGDISKFSAVKTELQIQKYLKIINTKLIMFDSSSESDFEVESAIFCSCNISNPSNSFGFSPGTSSQNLPASKRKQDGTIVNLYDFLKDYDSFHEHVKVGL